MYIYMYSKKLLHMYLENQNDLKFKMHWVIYTYFVVFFPECMDGDAGSSNAHPVRLGLFGL